MRNLATTIAAATLLTGCLGDFELGTVDDNAPPSGDSAEALFAGLHGQLVAECGACHGEGGVTSTTNGPDFMLNTDPAASYDLVRSYASATEGPIVGNSPANSKLYFYGLHTGAAPSASLAALIEAWIIAQASEDGTTPDPGDVPPPGQPKEPRTLVEALTMFADCMSYADFEGTNFMEIANQGTAEGQCDNCHNVGLAGAFLEDTADMFTMTKQMPYILKFASGVVNADGSFGDVVPSYRIRDKRGDQGHPNYILAAERVQALEDYFDLTYVRYRGSITSGVACIPEEPPLPEPQQ
jgi:hypothetical protein